MFFHPHFIYEVRIFFYNFYKKEVIIIVSKLYEYANAYDYEWAVPEFETGSRQGKRRERSENLSNDAEQLSASSGRGQSYCLVSTD